MKPIKTTEYTLPRIKSGERIRIVDYSVDPPEVVEGIANVKEEHPDNGYQIKTVTIDNTDV